EVVVYVSMASWCQVCRNHLPDLKRLRELMGGENLKIVAVPHDSTDTIEDITTFAGDAIATIEMWDRDDREAFRKMGRQVLGSEVLPTVMITKGDQVVEVITAVPTVSDLNGLLGE
ncbi:MAG: redoxin domain-containing protein, partial [Verrucomicrobiota bacterium]